MREGWRFTSVAGLLVLTLAFGGAGPSRTTILAVVLLVCVARLELSPRWPDRFSSGPVEWLWRSATYRSRQPFGR